MVSMSTLKLALDRLTVAVKRAEGRTAPWSEGATVDTAGAIPAVVLDSDASQTPRPVSANWAGAVEVGQRVRVEHAGTRTVITHAPDDTGWLSITLNAGFTGDCYVRRRNGWLSYRGRVTHTAGDWPTSFEAIGNAPLAPSSDLGVFEYTGAFDASGHTYAVALYATGAISVRAMATSQGDRVELSSIPPMHAH